MNQNSFVLELSKLRPASTFLVLNKYHNKQGEIADHMICFHISYENTLRKSLDIAQQYEPTSSIEKIAKGEVITSYQQSLDKLATTPIEEIDDAYDHFYDEERQHYVKGCKLHRDSGTLHIYGLFHQKRIIVPGEYKFVKSAPLTLAKRAIQRLCPASRFRQFKLLPGQVESIKVEKLTLLPPEDLSAIEV